MARKQLGAAPSNAADTATKAYVDTITDAKGQPDGFASLDGDGLVPLEQLPITTASWDSLDGKPAVVAAGATKADARSAIDAEDTGAKGQANGYASLDSNSLVPSAQLPSYVDDVLEYANVAAFPGTGVSGKIYIAADTSRSYRWSGSVYVEIVPSPGSSDSITEGTTNLFFTNSRADARISNAIGTSVQAYDADLTDFAGKSAPTGTVVGTSDTQTLTGKTISGSDNTLSNVAVSSLAATGTASSTTYLRGDGSWATPAGGNTETLNSFLLMGA